MNLSSELDRWLSPETLGLLNRIGEAAAGMGQKAYLVGGPVRDLLLSRTSLDLDVVVEGDAPSVARAVTAPGETEPVVHPSFGTATLRSGAFRVDLASARAESYPHPGALPVVRHGTLEQDLERRDFTINAMALTLDGGRRGELFDPYGGLADLGHGLLRVLHERSFVDDATRMLRGARYEQRFGFSFQERTLALLHRDISFLGGISPDRVRHEMERTFVEDEPEQVFARLDALGALSALHPALDFDRRKAWAFTRAGRASLSPAQLGMVYWCLLAWGVSAADVDSLVSRFNPTRRVRETMADAARLCDLEPDLDNAGLTPSEVFEALHGFSNPSLLAGELMFTRPVSRSNVSLYLHRLCHVRPSLTGSDLQTLGVPEGPGIGRILSSVRAARMDGEVSSREDEVRLVHRLLAG